jgi:hypothetical protein
VKEGASASRQALLSPRSPRSPNLESSPSGFRVNMETVEMERAPPRGVPMPQTPQTPGMLSVGIPEAPPRVGGPPPPPPPPPPGVLSMGAGPPPPPRAAGGPPPPPPPPPPGLIGMGAGPPPRAAGGPPPPPPPPPPTKPAKIKSAPQLAAEALAVELNRRNQRS